MVAVAVLQRFTLGVAHVAVFSTIDGEIDIGVVIDNNAVLVVLPCLAGEVVLILRDIGAEVGLWRTAKHTATNADDLFWLQGLPVVTALSGVLHHLDLRQVGTVGKGAVANDKVQLILRRIVVGIRVLEVEGL